MQAVTLKYKKVHPDAKIDSPAHQGDVGYDVYSVAEVYIPNGENREVPVGFALDIPEGYYITVETRSGHGIKKGLRAHRGIIDQGFRGEMSIQVYNHTKEIKYIASSTGSVFPDGTSAGYTVKKGEKIAQLVLHKVEVLPLEETQTLSETSRGEAKCGSTDKK